MTDHRTHLASRILHWPGRWTQGWAAFATAASGVLAAGLADLVVTDVLPNVPGDTAVDLSHSTVTRWICFAVVLLFFAWVFYSGSWQRRQKGTLFYVRLLAQGMPDFHADLAREDGTDRTSFRSLLHRFDAGDHPVTDLRAATEHFTDRVAELIHGDDQTTRTTVAPNLLFPAAVALGYSWEPPKGTVLQEFDAARDDRLGFSFTLEDVEKVWAAFDVTQIPGIGHRDEAIAGGLDQLVWLDVFLTDIGGEVGERLGTDFAVPGDHRIVGAPSPSTGHSAGVVAGPGGADPAVLAAVLAWHLLDLVKQDKQVIIVARVPKTVAVAAGWLLRQVTTGPQRQTLWSHLAPAMYLRGDPKALRIARVRFDQTDLSGMLTAQPS